MKTLHFSLLVLGLAPAWAFAQPPRCADGSCPLVATSRIEWRQRDDVPGEIYLFVDGFQVGGYRPERGEWRDFDGQTWSSPRALCLPADSARPFSGIEQTSAAGAVRNYGLELDKLSGREGGGYSLCGRSVSRNEALQALAGPGAFHDDSDLLRVTVIGEAQTRATVLEDLDRHEALQTWTGRALVSGLSPGNPRVRDAGFVTAGAPTIYIQAPGGQVLHRQDGYRGPESLAEALQLAERRRKDPNYDPAKDPDLNRLRTDNSLKIKSWHLYLVAGVLLAYLLRRKAS